LKIVQKEIKNVENDWKGVEIGQKVVKNRSKMVDLKSG
jgi:hypothetical protein